MLNEKKDRKQNFRQTQASSVALRLLKEDTPSATEDKALFEKQLLECSEALRLKI